MNRLERAATDAKDDRSFKRHLFSTVSDEVLRWLTVGGTFSELVADHYDRRSQLKG